MPDSILLNSDSRLLNGSGAGDLSHYGAQPNPIVSFAPAPTDARPLDPLGTAGPAQRTSAAPDDDRGSAGLDGTLAYLPPASDAAPPIQGQSAPVGGLDIDTPAARATPAPAPADAGSTSPFGSGSLTPAQIQPVLGDDAGSSPLAPATPSSLEPATIGSAVPVVDQLVSNVAALQAPVGQILSNVDTAVLTPLAGNVVAPLAGDVVAPVVSDVVAPTAQVLADTTAQIVQPVADLGADVGQAVSGTAEPVAQTVAAGVAPVTDAVTATVQPVADTVVAPVGAIVEPVAESAASITGPAVDAGIATLVDLVQAADMIVPPPPGAEPSPLFESDSGSIVDSLAASDPEESLLGVGSDDSPIDDGDNDGPLGFGGV